MKALHLNLGSGTDYIPGWVNVDIEQQYNPDVLADITQPLPFPDTSASEIKAFDILEHVIKQDAPAFLRECNRVLLAGGTIHIRVPNMFAIIEAYRDDPDVMAHFLYGDTSETGIYGAHKAGYTEKSLKTLLTLCGFENINISLEQTNYIVTAVKSSSIFKEKMTIGIIQQSPDFGGAEAYMCNLVEEWSKMGHKVHVATNPGDFEKSIKKTAKTVHTYNSTIDIIGDWKGFVKTCIALPFSYGIYSRILFDFRKKNVDIVVMSEFSERVTIAPLVWLFGLPLVWIEYGRPKDTFKRMFPWSKLAFRLVKDIPRRIITPTQYTQKSLMTDGRVSLACIDIIPCGTSIPVHRLSEPKQSKPFIIGCVSRLTREKGQEHLIRAVAKLVKERKNIELWLVGKGPDEKYFKELVDALGIQKYIHFTGFMKDIDDVYKHFDCVVFPSTWALEGFGLVLIEAMARGVPVVASQVGPVSEVIGDAGLGFEPGNVSQLYCALLRLMEDPSLGASLAKKGRTRATRLYNLHTISKRMIESFRTALCE